MTRTDIDWNAIEMVIFDVDGTLYDQASLRKQMLFKLMTHYVIRPWKVRDLSALSQFRKCREEHAGEAVESLIQEQYQWCKQKTNLSLERIKHLIEYWMEKVPLSILAAHRFDGLPEFFNDLKAQGKIRGVYSDYPFEDKMKSLELEYELGVSSTDADVSCLKPHPKGLQVLLSKTNIPAENCVFIGDRIERDGECAKRAGMKYLIIEKHDPHYFATLTKELNGK